MNNILNQIKLDLISATKAKNTIEKDILRLVISDCGALENSKEQGGMPLTDQQIVKVIKNIIIGNETTLSYKPNESLVAENEILKKYIPTMLSVDEIENNLVSLVDEIKTFKSEGQAVGHSVKHLKSLGLNADGNDVKSVVQKIRAYFMNKIKKLILLNVQDLVTNFLYYDRKEDEDLEYGEIEKAIREGTITIEEIVNEFSKSLKKQLKAN